ncbi:hypothetical protein AB6A40_004744 [Gnathostoma spinigerum]|uniref:VWFA domain-containing protein n=1 Tax=Gnathostoma spinigerum TaxID=75299 RepID=A0ABD6EDE6_9BILA
MKRLAETDADMSVGDLEEGAASEEVNEEIEKERYGHVDQGAGEVHERLAIDKSTVEEARRTRTGTEALREKLGQNLSEEKNNVNEIATEGEAAESSDTGKASRNDGLDNQNSIIHVQTSLLNLVEPLATADASSFQKDDDVVEGTIHAHDLWSQISDSVSLLSAELTESLRSVIEPTIASRLEGDYRSGKRLNMRRLISYIASDYRKDRIWLRRTKKSTRNYQILLAIDDSESMSYGKMKEITCQSICLIESALNRLEVGQLAICKFGRKVKLISDFTSSTESSLGGRLLSELTFSQDRTDLVNLMNAAKQIFRSGRDRSQSNQMMIIISDGRGALSGGAEKLKKALEAVAADTVTVLFIAVDNGSESIVDMQVAEFDPDGRVTLIPYMQRFPFSFYIVIREVSALPATLADAIRQWFEISLGSLPVRD